MSVKPELEHTPDLREARAALARYRKVLGRLLFISGGKGYDNMGRRELELTRDRIDEAEAWLARATQALNAGGKRARKLGFDGNVRRPKDGA